MPPTMQLASMPTGDAYYNEDAMMDGMIQGCHIAPKNQVYVLPPYHNYL
jgi:hypothetical protein